MLQLFVTQAQNLLKNGHRQNSAQAGSDPITHVRVRGSEDLYTLVLRLNSEYGLDLLTAIPQ